MENTDNINYYEALNLLKELNKSAIKNKNTILLQKIQKLDKYLKLDFVLDFPDEDNVDVNIFNDFGINIKRNEYGDFEYSSYKDDGGDLDMSGEDYFENNKNIKKPKKYDDDYISFPDEEPNSFLEEDGNVGKYTIMSYNKTNPNKKDIVMVYNDKNEALIHLKGLNDDNADKNMIYTLSSSENLNEDDFYLDDIDELEDDNDYDLNYIDKTLN